MEMTKASRLAPVVMYGCGLLFMFLGTRVFPTIPAAHMMLTAGGFALGFAYFALRLKGALTDGGERRSIQQLLAVFAFFSVLALALAFFTTEAGERLIPPIARATTDTREKYEAIATVIWVSLLTLTAIPIFFAERALYPMRRAENMEGRRVLSAEAAGLTLALAATYGALFTYAAGEFGLKADFSYFHTSRPSDSTKNIVRGLEDPVKVNIFFPPLNDVGREVATYLQELSQAGPKFTYEIHDRLLEPTLAKDWKVTQDGVLVVARGPTEETLTLGVDMETARTKLKLLDTDFQKALIKVSRETRTIYVTTGHGEMNESTDPERQSATVLRKLLESQNYTLRDLGLSQGLGTEIPKDATMVAVLGPTHPFLPGEVAALKKYAQGGGHLLLALDPDPGVDLEALAEIAGLSFSPVLLANEKWHLRRRFNDSDRTILVTNRYSSHASVTTLSRSAARANAIFAGATHLDSKPGADSALKPDFTVKALPDTFLDVNRDFQLQNNEKKATVNLAAAVSKKVDGQGDEKAAKEMRAFVVGDVDAFGDVLLGNEANAVLLIDAVRWLGGEESFSGSIATSEDVKIEHTKQKDLVLFYGTIFAVPSLVFGLGMLFSRRGRAKTTPIAVSNPTATPERKGA